MIEKITTELGKDMKVFDFLKEKKLTEREKIPEEQEYIPDIVYAYVGEKPLMLDLIQPKTRTEEKLPALIYIHGGGWHTGSRKAVPTVFLAMEGYVKISIDYRLIGEAGFPSQLMDCKTVVRWLKAHADDLKVDPDRIGVWGGSAGGHLASLLGVTEGMKEFEEGSYMEYSTGVHAVVSCSGPADLVELWNWKEAMAQFLSSKLSGVLKKEKERLGPLTPAMEGLMERCEKEILGETVGKALEQLMGGRPEEAEEQWRQGSPVTYVKPGLPPFLLMHGTVDPVVPVSQAYEFHDRLEAAGTDVTLVPLAGHGHNILHDLKGNFKRENAAYIISFFDKYLNLTERNQ